MFDTSKPVKTHRINGVDIRVLGHAQGNPVIASEDFDTLLRERAASAAAEMFKLKPELVCEPQGRGRSLRIYGRVVQWVPIDSAVNEIIDAVENRFVGPIHAPTLVPSDPVALSLVQPVKNGDAEAMAALADRFEELGDEHATHARQCYFALVADLDQVRFSRQYNQTFAASRRAKDHQLANLDQPSLVALAKLYRIEGASDEWSSNRLRFLIRNPSLGGIA